MESMLLPTMLCYLSTMFSAIFISNNSKASYLEPNTMAGALHSLCLFLTALSRQVLLFPFYR